MNFSKQARLLLIFLALAALFFALGLLSADFFRPAQVAPTSSPSSAQDAAQPQIKEPKILFDPNSIHLLPDASLQISPPTLPDAAPIQ